MSNQYWNVCRSWNIFCFHLLFQKPVPVWWRRCSQVLDDDRNFNLKKVFVVPEGCLGLGGNRVLYFYFLFFITNVFKICPDPLKRDACLAVLICFCRFLVCVCVCWSGVIIQGKSTVGCRQLMSYKVKIIYFKCKGNLFIQPTDIKLEAVFNVSRKNSLFEELTAFSFFCWPLGYFTLSYGSCIFCLYHEKKINYSQDFCIIFNFLLALKLSTLGVHDKYWPADLSAPISLI